MSMIETRLEWLYDLEARVEETNPDSKIMAVHGIKPAKYLLLQDSEKVFPQDYALKSRDIFAVPTNVVENPTDELDLNDLADYDIDVSNAKPGEVVPVTLIQSKKGLRFTRYPIINDDVVAETSGLREGFLRDLQELGIQPEPNKAYSRVAFYKLEDR
ncbi:MAG: hypothetical protein ACMXX5_01740 [Candidatus Woesearchaeota archaeon]